MAQKIQKSRRANPFFVMRDSIDKEGNIEGPGKLEKGAEALFGYIKTAVIIGIISSILGSAFSNLSPIITLIGWSSVGVALVGIIVETKKKRDAQEIPTENKIEKYYQKLLLELKHKIYYHAIGLIGMVIVAVIVALKYWEALKGATAVLAQESGLSIYQPVISEEWMSMLTVERFIVATMIVIILYRLSKMLVYVWGIFQLKTTRLMIDNSEEVSEALEMVGLKFETVRIVIIALMTISAIVSFRSPWWFVAIIAVPLAGMATFEYYKAKKLEGKIRDNTV